MPQVSIYSILIVFLAIFLIYAAGMILMLPIKIIVRLIINGVVGAILLFVLNIVGGYFGLTIGINPITALIAGFLGIPGIILLLFLQLLL